MFEQQMCEQLNNLSKRISIIKIMTKLLWTNFVTMREPDESDVEDKDCGVFDDQKDPDYVVFP